MQIQCFSKIATKQRVDKAAGIIYGVSVIAKGLAVGHDVTIDEKTLSQVKDTASQFKNGLKVRANHPKKGQDAPIESIIGALRAFRIDGEKVVADLHLLKSDANYEKFLELAEEQPENFGLSIVFSGTPETEDDVDYLRCTEIYACDLVDDPAANPTGLFSKGACSCEHCGKADHLCSCSAMSSDDHYSEYGDVPYADSENHKYPIDTESHVRAAWSYINMPKNAKKYPSGKLASVKAKIKAAAKKHGIKISDKSEQSTPMNEEQKALAKSLGLPDDTTVEQLNAELQKVALKKMSEEPPKKKKGKKDGDQEDDPEDEEMAAIRAELAAQKLSLEQIAIEGRQSLARAKREQITTLLSEAAAAGKVVPFDQDDLYTEKDGKVTIKMEPSALSKVISKLEAGAVKTVNTKPEAPKGADGKPLLITGLHKRRNAQQLAATQEYCERMRSQNAPIIGAHIKRLHAEAMEKQTMN